jgi:hypothetical protein
MKPQLNEAPPPAAEIAALPTVAQLMGPLNAVTGVCAAYCVSMLVHLPQLWYLPLAHAWTFALQPVGLGMAWYGRSLAILGFGAVAGIVCHRLGRRAGERLVRVSALLTLTSFLVACALCVGENWDRETRPIPHPDGVEVRCAP